MNNQLDEALEQDELEKKLNELLSTLSTRICITEDRMAKSNSITNVNSNTLMEYLTSFQPVMAEMLRILPQIYTFLPMNEERDLREIADVMMKAVQWIDDPLPTSWERRYTLIRKCLMVVKTCSVKFKEQQLFDYCVYDSYKHNAISIWNWNDLKLLKFN